MLPVSEDGIFLHLFVLTQNWHVTDRWTDRNSIANTSYSIAACCKKSVRICRELQHLHITDYLFQLASVLCDFASKISTSDAFDLLK